jgi:CHAT domain-containing protein/pimeloyl-ACP methyl ester carboxylesterase
MAKKKQRRKRAARRAIGRARSPMPPGSAPQTQPVDMKDSAVEAALKSGEHSGLLEDYFGTAQYAELKRLSQDAAQRGARGGERVLILPGIMGSKLGYPRSMWFDDVIWADPVDIALGRLGELKLNGGSSRIDALGVMLFAYLKLKLKLQLAGYDVDFFPFDWRKTIVGIGKDLAAQIKKEGRKVHLVAHSMGGLVARASLIEKPKNLERIVMLGTPNFGSFSPIQAFRGNLSLANKIAFIDLSHSKEDLANIFRSFPGLCELIPSPEKYPTDFFDLKSWPKAGVLPSKKELADALKTQRQLPTEYGKLYIIAGIDQETVVDATIKNDEFVYTTSPAGDGTVPLQCVLLPAAQETYYVVESHGSLPNNSVVADAVDSILSTGTTKLLPTSYESHRAGPLRTIGERQLEAPPYQGNRGRVLSAAEKRNLIEEVAAPDRAPTAPPALVGRTGVASATAETAMATADTIVIGRRRQHRLEVTLVFGSITEVEADAYVLGMFQLVPPGGAAVILNDMLGGAISQMLSRRMFNANVGEISMLPTGKHPVRADVVAFAGLGSFDGFTPDTLEIVGENLVRTFVSTRIDEFATVPIGGSTGAFSATSLRKLMTGFVRGLRDADSDHRFRGIAICETDRDRFIALQSELYKLCGTKLLDDVEVTLREVELAPPTFTTALRQVTPVAPPSMFLLVREEPKPAPGTIEYTCSVLTVGAKATVYKARQSVRKADLDRHLAKLATDRGLSLPELEEFGTELTKLILPDSVMTAVTRHLDAPLAVVHDAGSSRIPWETLRLGDKFPALGAGLSHRYEAEDLSIAKWLEERQRDAVLDVLLVVNPTKDLPGAEAEGKRVRDVLEKLGRSATIRELSGNQARKNEIKQCLASGEFDVLHYAGHAFFDPADPSSSGILCSGREVLSGSDLANLGRLPSLAVFNACESGRVRRGSTTAQINTKTPTDHRVQRGASFAEAFLRGGIANYLGTYWPVGDDAALRFAENFYQRLINGENLGDAVMAGRKAVEKIGSSDWADYILYGDPAFVLKKA